MDSAKWRQEFGLSLVMPEILAYFATNSYKVMYHIAELEKG